MLFTTQSIEGETKKVNKLFVTNYDGEYPAKSPVGMFKDLYITNDLGLVIEKVNAYNLGIPEVEAQ